MFDYIESILGKTHAKEQALRFVRIFAMSVIPQLLLIGANHLTRTAVISVVIAAAETAFRQVFPASTWTAIHNAAEATTTEPPTSAVQ